MKVVTQQFFSCRTVHYSF